MYKHIFDLDNTLVFTDELNSEAYNYALVSHGKEPIYGVKRITREVIFSRFKLTEDEKDSVVKIKQNFFFDHLEKIKKNDNLLKLLIGEKPADCILWTSAEKCRVEAILNYLKLKDYFSWVYCSTKTNIKVDLENICQHFKCSKLQLKFYENNIRVLNELNLFGINNKNMLKIER